MLNAALITKIADRLSKAGFRYSRIEQVQMQNITLNVAPSMTMQSQAQPGWRLVSDDNRWTATVASDFVTIETTRYGRWSKDFRPRMNALFTEIAATVKPSVELRLGLRYVDLFTEPIVDSPAKWTRWIAPVLSGALADAVIGQKIMTTQQQMTIEIDESIRVTVRHGCYPDSSRDGAYTYLIDTDHYRDSLMSFNLDSILNACDKMHEISLSLFRYFITDDLFTMLKKPKKK